MVDFDVVVVGGGHAGAEAAWAAARLGAKTALITMERDAIARLSCNPAIGGLGKGQIVREIDALGGLMGLATDRAGIQFRVLNRSKGHAVQAPRAQADRNLYPAAVQDLLARDPRIEIIEGVVEKLVTVKQSGRGPAHRIRGVVLVGGLELTTSAVILTTGTFLRGLMHRGSEQSVGGRIGEASSEGMSGVLRSLGFELGRLKTGTPPRVHRDTIDYDACTIQPGDDRPVPFSFMNDEITQRQVVCWITYTNAAAHDLIRANLHRAPMYTGQIESTGPRYCPSIEDKVVRFADKSRHQVFLEPEGYDDERVYCNGISTSLPRDVQDGIVAQIGGLERARIVQYGYAVEYDFVPTEQTKPSLESKPVGGLFLAGQINGTSGYEEAAGQGLVAGVNAVHALGGDPPLVLGRDEAYIGVMIDDLVTRPPTEPYRMFTSRAEYRLLLRSDNADQRLTPIGRRIGLVDDARWQRFERRRDAIAAIETLCARSRIAGVAVSTWMRRPEANPESLAAAIGNSVGPTFAQQDLAQVLINAKYDGYVSRQADQIERFRRLETMPIPTDLDFSAIPQLRIEARERLARVTPHTLGQAGRIAGVTPADVSVLWVFLTKRSGRGDRTGSTAQGCS
ncbi:MAG: tRNA uridine-5-carboxymethylaminomethyl(34) synthesis enzyme MnmG [Planctomycetes bacterium]|nr:tRNA uridine-5-carboxymethylaminomethyl(34) synthesis enzyme MnmG [Planctomycetota bacterium]